MNSLPRLVRRLLLVFSGAIAALAVLLAALWLWNPALVLVAGFEAAGHFNRNGGTGGNDCSGQWSPGIDADNPYIIPFFPESGARYHLMALDATRDGRPVELRVSGRMPQARHASLHVYDAKSARILGALADAELARPGEEFSFAIRQQAEGAVGVLTVPPGSEVLALAWRVYLPEGAAELPHIRLHDAASGVPISPCRNRFLLPDAIADSAETQRRNAVTDAISALQAKMVAEGDATPIRFYAKHPETTPFYANRQVVYAFAPLDRRLGDAALVEFRVPPTQAVGGPSYWSVCLSGLAETGTSACIAVRDVRVGPDSVARFIIGATRAELDATLHLEEYNGLAWGWFRNPRVLIIRQLHDAGAADFPGSFRRIPDLAGMPADGLQSRFADRHIGDFAPRGRYCRRTELAPGGACAGGG
jgi:hypothetical protein